MRHPQQRKLSCFKPPPSAAPAHQHHPAHTCRTQSCAQHVCEQESRWLRLRLRLRLTAVLSVLRCSRAADRLTVWSGPSEPFSLHSAVSGHLSAVWLPRCWLKEWLPPWRENLAAVSYSGSFHQLTISFLIQVECKCNSMDALKKQSKCKQAATFQLSYLFLQTLIDFFF